MSNNSDLTFITNEKGQNLLERFKVLIKDTEFFDVLVGYFYTSGFHALYKSLEKTKRIRILIGISTSKRTVELIEKAKQSELPACAVDAAGRQFSHAETKEHFSNLLVDEMSDAEDSRPVEEGVMKFWEWLQNGKLEIKAYPTENIHAKLYIMSFLEGDRDVGRVITGSSNFTQAGLVDNLEFNTELKNRADYDFAKAKFEELWKDAVDVKDKYVQTIQERTWLNNTITPYQLYLKFLYEYFKDELCQTDEVIFKYAPTEFKRLEYQEQAVLNAKKILEEYGGVFISDVVGLGKTYVSAMLSHQLDGRNLVIAPPVLLEKSYPGSWPNAFEDFGVRQTHFESIGKLDDLIREGIEKYKNVIIDEAHRFRTETTISYEKLAQICRGKRVILVTATPYNNSPKDILSQIKLFQKTKKSTIPNVPNLESFFGRLEQRIKKLDRKKDRAKYMQTAKENAKEIREKVLKYLMVRRTRKEIETYFSDDLKNQKLKFPEVETPEPIFYQLNKEENEIFNKTVELVARKFKYARYMPMLYYKGDDRPDQLEIQSQKNMGRFMKILLIKRLESSFHAFRNTVNRFVAYYVLFLKELEQGNVYVSKKYANKIFELLENDDEAIQNLIESDKAKKYPAKDFTESLKEDLENDLRILKEIQELWSRVKRDPKLLSFVDILSSRQVLKKNKIIVFSESKETVEYLAKNLEKKFPDEVLSFTGGSSALIREKVIENFDARARFPKDDYRILIATEVLSEGVNLHRSNTVINYDIPWNPTRLMQRVGRINRVDTKFDKIYTFNFFPTEQSNDQIKLKEAAEAKIQAFITLLGADAQLLTEGEAIESHELFNRLISKKTITGEDEGDESELKYLQIIRGVRDIDPDLFEKIKRLPKKARTAKKYLPAAQGTAQVGNSEENQLLTYFRKGKLQKFFITSGEDAKEIDFITAAKLLESNPKDACEKLNADFYDKLEKNKQAFVFATTEEDIEIRASRGGRDSAMQALKILKAVFKDTRQLTEDQIDYYKKVMMQFEEGAIPKQTAKTVNKVLNKELLSACGSPAQAGKQGRPNPLKVLALLQNNIPSEFLESHIAESAASTFGPREVILSEYLIGK